MPKKKTAAKKKSGKGGAPAAKKAGEKAAQTRCEQGGDEIKALVVRYRRSAIAEFHFFLCRTNAQILVFVEAETGELRKLVDQSGIDEVHPVLPRLKPGFYTLTWHFMGAGPDWQTRAELTVDGVTRFLLRKDKNTSKFPFERGFLFLEVL